jgi:hypothetical protein
MAKKTRNAHMSNQNKMANQLDQLALFEEMQAELLPKLQKLIRQNASPEKIYKEFAALAAARTVSVALTEEDSGKALAAVKEVLDRTQGKATEKVETTHKYSKLDDAELDNLLKSTLAGVELDDENLPN